MRFSAVIFALAIGILCQGCVVCPYPTPVVKGSVIDASTKQPIAAVRIAVHNHIGIHCRSADDGVFNLHSGSAWRPCFLMPGDVFVIWADVSFKARGYYAVSRRYTAFGNVVNGYAPVVLKEPIELKPIRE